MNRRPNRPTPRPRPKPGPGKFPKGLARSGQRPQGRPEIGPRIPPDRRSRSIPAPVAATPSGREGTHVAPLEILAESAVAIARQVERVVLDEKKRADRALAFALRGRRDLALPDHRFISQAAFALFRWRGWIEPLRLPRDEARLLLAWLLDAPHVHPVCRAWAEAIGRDPSRLVALGDAPSWTARAEGLKRWLGGRAITADPWRLFPDWLREHLPLPPGGGSPKLKYLELLNTFQTRPPLWVRAQGPDEKATWAELAELGVKPWVQRRISRAAKLPFEGDLYHLAPFLRGELEIQDLASQAVGLACDPDPGERWWDACAGAGGKALHLAALMGGKGVVVATDTHSGRLKETVRRARRSPFRNLTTKEWDGRHVAGKPRSFDGVLVDAPCSAIGTWRRNPDARWTLDRQAIPRLVELQRDLLRAASAGVRPGGTLVYSVCTLTPAETLGVVRAFLDDRPEFQLDPFPHPLTDVPTDGTLLIWPQDADTDAMFIARMVRAGG
ncbi:MAG: RsmB/NOP family class I SAM-dependent RNA methyltransferase [Planctomycetaceae bacterium]